MCTEIEHSAVFGHCYQILGSIALTHRGGTLFHLVEPMCSHSTMKINKNKSNSTSFR